MSNILNKLNKLFSCGERLNALDLNSIVSVYNDIINYLNDQGSSPGTVNTLNWPLDSINSAGLSDNGGTRDIGANMVIASTEEEGKWQWLQINNNTGLLWDDLNGGKGNDNTIIDPTHIPLATNNTVGGIKIGYPVNHQDKKYPVELDSDTKGAYVHVPWTGGDGNVTSINEIPIQNGTPKEGLILKYETRNNVTKWYFADDETTSGSNPGDDQSSSNIDQILTKVWRSLSGDDSLISYNDDTKILNSHLDLSFFNSAGNESSNPLKNYTWWGNNLEVVGTHLGVTGNLSGNIKSITFGSDNDALILGLDGDKLKLYKANGLPATFYATGGVSALGIGTSEGGESTGVILGDFLASLNGLDTPKSLGIGYLYCDGQKVEWIKSGPGNSGINITGDLPGQRGAGNYVLLYNIVSDGNDGTQTSYTVSSTKYEPLVNSVLKQINASTTIEAKSNDKENLGKHSLYYEVTSKTTTNNNGEEVTTYSGQWMWNKVGNNSELNKILTGINSDQDLNSFIDSTHNEASNKILYYKIVKKKEAVTDPNDETVIISPAEYSGTWQWGDFKEAVGLGNILSSIDGLDGLNLPPNNLESDKILHYVVTKNIVDDPENPGSTITTYDASWQFMDLSSINSLKNEVLIHLNNSNTKFIHPSSVIKPDLNNSNYTYLNAGTQKFRIDSGIDNAVAVSKYYDTVFVYLSVLCDNGQVVPYWKTCEFNTTLISKLSKIDDKVANLNRKAGYLHRTKSYNDFTYEWVDNIEGDLLNEPLKTLNGVSFPAFDDVTDEEGAIIYGKSGKKILTCEAIHKQNQETQTEYTEYVWNYEPYSFNPQEGTIYNGSNGILIEDPDGDGKYSVSLKLCNKGLKLDDDGLGVRLVTSNDNSNISGLQIVDDSPFYGLKIKLSSDDNGLELSNSGLKVKLATNSSTNTNNSGLTFDNGGGLKINIANNGGLTIGSDGLKLSSTSLGGLLNSSNWAAFFDNVKKTTGNGYLYINNTTNNNQVTIEPISILDNYNGSNYSYNNAIISEIQPGDNIKLKYNPNSKILQIFATGTTTSSISWDNISGTAPDLTTFSNNDSNPYVRSNDISGKLDTSTFKTSYSWWGQYFDDETTNIGTIGKYRDLNYVRNVELFGVKEQGQDDTGGTLYFHTATAVNDNRASAFISNRWENDKDVLVFNTHYGTRVRLDGQGASLLIGNVKIINDNSNTLRIEGPKGTAGNLYATGGISALGLSSGSSPSIGNLTVTDTLSFNSNFTIKDQLETLENNSTRRNLHFGINTGGVISFGSVSVLNGTLINESGELWMGADIYLQGHRLKLANNNYIYYNTEYGKLYFNNGTNDYEISIKGIND